MTRSTSITSSPARQRYRSWRWPSPAVAARQQLERSAAPTTATDGRRRSASRTATSARSSSTRRAAPSTSSRRTPGRRARAPATAPATGLRCGRTASRQSVAGRMPRWSEPPCGPTERHRSPTTATRSTSSQGDKKPGDTNGQGITAFGGGWYAVSADGNQVSAAGELGWRRRIWLLVDQTSYSGGVADYFLVEA